jgi:hypothetical protein
MRSPASNGDIRSAAEVWPETVVTPGATTASLDELVTRQAAVLRQFLDQLDREAHARAALSTRLLAELAQAECAIRSEQRQLAACAVDSARQRTQLLDGALALLHVEARQEHRQCWQDQARLARDWRLWAQQYQVLAARLTLLRSAPPAPYRVDGLRQ